MHPNVWFDWPRTERCFGSGSVVCGSATFIRHGNRPICRDSVDRRCAIPNSAKAGQAAGLLSETQYWRFSLFTEVLLHVLSNWASRYIALQKLMLKLCPGCCLVERESRASILDWVSIAKPKFSFSFWLFGERRKVRRRKERKRKRWKRRLWTANPKSLLLAGYTPPSDHHGMRLTLVFDSCVCVRRTKSLKRTFSLRASLLAIAIGQIMAEYCSKQRFNFSVIFLDIMMRRVANTTSSTLLVIDRTEPKKKIRLAEQKKLVRLLREYSNPARLKSDTDLSESRTEIRFAKPP